MITIATLLLRLAGHHRSAGHPYIWWCRHWETGLEIGQNHEMAQLWQPMTFFGGHLPPHNPYMSEKPFSQALRNIWIGGVNQHPKKDIAQTPRIERGFAPRCKVLRGARPKISKISEPIFFETQKLFLWPPTPYDPYMSEKPFSRAF